ncbi:helix-turn-helix domain-containing protein [uncultured Corynebacterium sp.]|nr:helix-turn-helix domain-containing protein [uncultured Corynebacterium sp.]
MRELPSCLERICKVRTWINAGVPKAEVARRLGVGRMTLYCYLGS